MLFDMKPDNREILEIFKAQVHGSYRFIHDALKPYVRIEPSSPGQFITVHAGDHLRLTQNAQTKRASKPIDFAVIFDYSHVRLVEVSAPDPRVLTGRPATQAVDWPITEVPSRPVEPTPVKQLPTIIVQPDPPLAPSPPSVSTVPVLPLFKEIQEREDVQPALDDYLVIPSTMLSEHEPIPPWVVRSPHVDCIHVVKRRLGTDSIVGAD